MGFNEGGGDTPFDSTLSVNEFALLSQMGPHPIATVQGTSVYQVGWQYLPPEAQSGGEDLFCGLDAISRAWGEARNNAFDRLREEARIVGADVVLGVQLRRGEHDWARRSVEYVVNGTAVRLPPGDPRASADAAGPLLSDLSVQDYWKLAGGGWSPAGLLAATSAYFIAQGSWTRWQRRRSVMENQERWAYSDGFSAARHAVVADMRRQAQAIDADGIVGMSLDYEISPGSFTVQGGNLSGTSSSAGTILVGELTPTGRQDRRKGVVVTFHSVGTAIRRDHAHDRRSPTLDPILSLGGRT